MLMYFFGGTLLGLWAGWIMSLIVFGRCLQPRTASTDPDQPTDANIDYALGYSDGWCDAAGVVEVDFGVESALFEIR